MIVIDLAGEKFQDALCGLWCGREERRRLEIRRRREDDIGGHAVDISHFYLVPCPVVKRVIKDVITHKSSGRGMNLMSLPKLFEVNLSTVFGVAIRPSDSS